MKKIIVACVVTGLVVGGGTAAAQRLITSSQIRDGTIRSADIRNGTIRHGDIRRFTITRDRLARRVRRLLSERAETGPAGPAGPAGPSGPKGEKGDPGSTLSAGNWGVMNRGTIGSPNAFLRSGPATPASSPPFGRGSLNLDVAAPPTTSAPERAGYGNEVDFFGDLVQDLTAVGFHVFTTGENIGAGGSSANMPSITFEVDPNLASSPSNFSSLVFTPANTNPSQWSSYIDATTTGLWGGTGSAFAGEPCNLNAARCSFADLQAFLNDGGDPATIFTAAVTKGRDFSFSGGVDGLRINSTVYDFEEHGIVERAP